MSHDSSYLNDILKAAQLILRFVQGMDEAAFRRDIKTQDAVIWRIAIIGEATKQLTEAFTANHPEIPWKDKAGMRDIMVHSYNKVSAERVWNTVQNDIPTLIAQIEPLVPPDTPEESDS